MAKPEPDSVIRVAIVDDDEDVRNGYRWMIERSTGFVVTGTYTSCSDIRRNIDESPPDVVLMDIGLPEKSGIECVRLLKREYPNIQFLMLTVYTDDENIFQSLRAGAVGYLLKKTTPAKLLEAISHAYHGGAPIASEIARKVLAYFQQLHTASVTDSLSPREIQVLEALIEGHSYKAIADKLFLSIHTVRFHLQNIYAKLHVNTRTEAVAKALKSRIA